MAATEKPKSLSAKVGDTNINVWFRDGQIIASYVRGNLVEHVPIVTDTLAAFAPDAMENALKAAKAKLRVAKKGRS